MIPLAGYPCQAEFMCKMDVSFNRTWTRITWFETIFKKNMGKSSASTNEMLDCFHSQRINTILIYIGGSRGG